MSSRRDALATINLNISERPNAGLWLYKYMEDATDTKSRADFARQVAEIEEPSANKPDEIPVYKRFYDSWEKTLKEELNADCRKAKVQNRMVVGLGADGVLETSVALHRTYGVPYIPGSALKGLTAAFARHYCGVDWQQDSTKGYYKIVFGTNDEAGYVTFFDALYVPNSGHDKKALHFDIMTVHHESYYQGKKDDKGHHLPPADWDDPNPIPFISTTGEYLIALAAPEGCEAWLNAAHIILEEALKCEGIGAKTSSGYGRMEIIDKPAILVDEDKSFADALIEKIKSIPDSKLPGELGEYANKLINSTIKAQHKKRVAELIVTRTTKLGNKQQKRFEEKRWFAPIQIMLKS
ncbi:MAG: type III-B CRISPR module RAMP protein Cmr6 [Acidobacteria bacterium 13_1_20CM_3_53_8]|nr:MAG: type III-B CRISPR module RAMP protein Cmr6 [Acidobacteria bacterium 13_1_20CM_3_53_8]